MVKQGQADEESRPLGAVALGTNGSADFLDDLGGNREPEAGAAVLGGVKGQKQALANFFGEAVASVGNLNFYSGAIFG
jgi:hypothetical protein